MDSPILESNHRKSDKWATIGICCLLVALVVVVFGRTVSHDFINYDDPESVSENPVVSKGLSIEGVGWAFTHTPLGHWDPLATLSHMADCQLYGSWPGGHHLTNVSLHAASAVLLFLFLLEFTGGFRRSAFAAAVWAIHPLRVESVAWVAERKDVLSGLFFMLALLAYGWYARRPGWSRYATLAVSFALGLMSKSMLVTLPLVLLLLDYWPLKRFVITPGESRWRNARRLCLEKVPLLLVSMIFAVAQINADQKGIVTLDQLPLAQRAGNAVVSYVVYLRQMVRPVNLAAFYPHPRATLPVWDVVFAAAVLGVSSVAAVLTRKKQPWLIVGWLWYLLMLTPVIGIVQSGNLARADRYTYLPQIGLCIAGTWAAADWAGEKRYRRLSLEAIAIIALSVLSVAAWRQTGFWRDSITLWTHTLGCTKDNYIAMTNLAAALLDKGRDAGALEECRQALVINPDHFNAQYNLGLALFRQGTPEESIARYPAAVEGWNDGAISHYRAALQIDPGNVDLHNNLGDALAREGRTEEAIAQYRAALKINPGNAAAHYNLGKALSLLGQSNGAIKEYREALRSNPDYADAHNNLAIALVQQGKTAEAIAELQKALELQPSSLSHQNNLAWMLATVPQTTLRNGAKALQLALQASQSTGGNNPSILRTLAAAYAQAGKYPEAISTARSALRIVEAGAFADMLRRDIKFYETGLPLPNGS